MIEEKKSNMMEEQTVEPIKEGKNAKVKIDTAKAAVDTENSKRVSDDVIIEIVHAFKDIIIEFIHRKYQTPSK